MPKRLMTGLAAGVLAAAMVPGLAAAEGKGPPGSNSGICVKEGIADRAADPSTGIAPAIIFDESLGFDVKGPVDQGQSPFTLGLSCGPPPSA